MTELINGGGAERVLLALHNLFPEAPLYTSVYNKRTAQWAKVFDVRSSFLQKFPYAESAHEWYPILMPLAFESFSFDKYDLVISVTSEAAKGIITSPKTKHICYCLTPTRYLWSGYYEYFKNSMFKTISQPAVSYLRTWDKIAAERPDVFLAISKEVQSRIKKYYNRDSEIIYPPIYPTLHDEKFIPEKRDKGYFLIVSRLVKYKRIDLAIKACNMLQLPLKIVGVGSELTNLKRIAGPTISFLGSLTDTELVRYYKESRAFIFPGKEDFGLTVVEAQSFGKPVIAYKEGGTLETIIEGKTGEFFYPQTEHALVESLKKFMEKHYNPKDAIKHAAQFNQKDFEKRFMSIINTL